MTAATQESVIRRLVETSDDLPALPQIWIKVRRVTEDLRASAHDVAEIILKDQAMTARVLRTANSAIYAGYHQRITTITNAIVLLGFREVRNIVLGYAAFNMLSRLRRNTVFDFKSFWVHSLATAVGCRMLAESLEYELPEEAFVAGLLHDVGKLLAACLMPEQYGRFAAQSETAEDLLQLERRIFGADHQQIGEWAAVRWAFPRILVQAISRHHRTNLQPHEKSRPPLIDMVHVADAMAKIIFRTTTEARRPDARLVQQQAQKWLGLSRERWAMLLRKLADNVRELISEFQLTQDDLESYTAFLEDSHIEHVRTEKLYEEMNRELTEKVKELNTLHQFSTALLQASSRQQVVELLVESIYRAVNFSRVVWFAVDREENVLKARHGYGADVQPLLQNGRLALADRGAIATSGREGRILNILNAASPLYAEQVSRAELELLRCASFACVPLMGEDGALGVIVVDNHVPAEPIPDHRLAAVATFVNQASLGLQRLPLTD